MRSPWLAFAPFAVVSAVHVGALAAGADALAAPTKLALMPLLLFGAWWMLRRGTPPLLAAGIGLSWLGDGAGVLLPRAPEIPTMLLFFGLAHVCYIVLFLRTVRARALPPWSIVYAAWWGILLAVLWPYLGALLVSVALYGLILGGTAVAASRCHPLIAWGGALFLTSDSVLAFRLFVDGMPDWTSPLVMLTYTLGQGLIAAGAVVTVRARRERVTG